MNIDVFIHIVVAISFIGFFLSVIVFNIKEYRRRTKMTPEARKLEDENNDFTMMGP
jgi:hypothetical protein